VSLNAPRYALPTGVRAAATIAASLTGSPEERAVLGFRWRRRGRRGWERCFWPTAFRLRSTAAAA
jgi:hypothetical protein